MSAWYIRTRSEFQQVLGEAIAALSARCQRVPRLGLYHIMLEQLRSMQAWSAHGRTPTPSERDRIDVGLIAIREVDPQDDDDDAHLHELLVQLDGYFTEWPEDEHID